ncbi:acyl-CoA N-acyltransferase [Triangularia verruculosa]|uniref:N-alpha-acetyltransferase 40 n=1 Tax=Triangularia verruculosa TaxID=2587418 RepID=A0AAN7AY95_9PEZI|nr:acyl-CoA N-acyltransferase [Triangularia verruculosa]
MRSKRPRAPTSPIEVANRKTDEQFIADYLLPGTAKDSPWTATWTHPKTATKYTLTLTQPSNLSQADLNACFNLLVETSKTDYENSAGRWHPDKKLKEMTSPDLRYILVKHEQTGQLQGFTSLMPTYEEGQPVVYCYEIHLKPVLQGTGLGSLLMGFHTTVALNLPPITKVMLTCFLSNARGLAFYRKLGFERDDISPVGRVLRGKVVEPDYVIMSKRIRPDSEGL